MTAPLLSAGDLASSRAATAPELLVAVDFDGTVARIMPDPADATFVPGAREALARLARAPRTAVGVVTGRTLADVQARVGLAGVYYAGNHGSEIAWDARRWSVADDPAVAARVAALVALGVEMRRFVAEEPGAVLEEKGLSLSLHYRQVPPPRQAAFAERVGRWLDARRGQVVRGTGKGVIEVRPAGVPGKEAAIRTAARWAAERLGRAPLVLFLGDDDNDEPALEAVREGAGLAVAVGERPSAAATHRLAGPDAAAAWLTWLADRRGRR